jgi:hypothetical protein
MSETLLQMEARHATARRAQAFVDANSNNCIAVGNRLLANTAGNESDSSGTSTMNNETT